LFGQAILHLNERELEQLQLQPVFWRLGIGWLPAKITHFGGWRLGLLFRYSASGFRFS
jgi:hypothetical protein